MNPYAETLWVVGRFTIAVAINLSLFLIIPVSQNFFKLFDEHEKEAVSQPRIVAEYVKPKQPEPKRETSSRIRTVSSEASQPVQGEMKFKFTPDLAVGGGGDGVAIQGSDLEAEVFEEGQVDVDVIPVKTPMPQYSKRARDLAVEGDAVVTFVVDVDGGVKAIEKIDAPHPSMVPEIREAVLAWKFKPAQNNGIPVRKRVTQPFEFRLD